MIADEYNIVRFFPEYFLDYQEILNPKSERWYDCIHSSTREWTGSAYDFFIMVNNKLTVDLKTSFKLENIVRVDNTSMHDAVRDEFVNFLSNADYYGSCDVVIKKYKDHIEYDDNLGSLRVGKEQMLQDDLSNSHKKNIMKIFNLIGLGEKVGSGFPFIVEACKDYNMEIPKAIENLKLNRTSIMISIQKQDDELSMNEYGEEMNNSAKNNKTAENELNNSSKIDKFCENNSNNFIIYQKHNGRYKTSFNIYDFISKEVRSSFSEKRKQNLEMLYFEILSNNIFFATELSRRLNISTHRIRGMLSILVEIGLIKEEGITKRRRYYAVEIDDKYKDGE